MRTILALSLIAAAFASAMPVVAAECVNTTCVTADGYAYGSCDNGSSGQYVSVTNYDSSGYTAVGVNSYCYNYGIFSGSGVGAYGYTCDANWNCDQAGANWQSYSYFGSSYCDSSAYTYVDGTYTPTALPLCDVAGAPPAVPVVLP